MRIRWGRSENLRSPATHGDGWTPTSTIWNGGDEQWWTHPSYLVVNRRIRGFWPHNANFFWPSVLRCSHEAKLVMAWLWYLHVWRWSSSGRMPYPMICRQVEERMLGWPRMEIFVATPGSFFLVHWFCTYDSERDFICGCWSLVLSMQHKKCCWWSHLKGKIALKWRPHCGMGATPTVLDHPKKGMGSIIGTALEAAEKELDPPMFHCPCLLPNKS